MGAIEKDFFEIVNEVFHNFELSGSQYNGMIALLHKGGDRDNICNWRPITLLNTDYKIISKLLANRTKPVLKKLIHSDQKGFVEGRNISESNRMIDDIINYMDEADQEGIIVFVDQEKAYDRVEWGWVNHVLKGFNFGSKCCGLIQMLFKNAKTCIKTNGFISRFFSLSWSARMSKYMGINIQQKSHVGSSLGKP